MATDSEVGELREWLEKLFGQVQQMRIDQQIWEDVQKIIERNPQLHVPSHFYSWMQDMYVSGIAMSIRRQVDNDTRTMSFCRFLKRIKGDPSVVSRSRYRALYKDGDGNVEQLRGFGLLEKTVNDTYDRVVGANKLQPTADDIQKEIDDLASVAERFVDFANQVVAHDDVTKPATLPTFGEVDTVIAYMETLVQRYAQLFEASLRLMSVNFQDDWRAIFRTPWIP